MASTNRSDSSLFAVHLSLPVRFRHLDAMGHVNNAVFLSYFEDARVAYHQALAGGEPFAPTDFQFILAQVTCNYRSPAYFGETLLVGIRVTSVGRKSFVFEYEIRDQASGRLVADGHSVQVMYDYGAQRSQTVSDEFLARLEALEGHSIPRAAA